MTTEELALPYVDWAADGDLGCGAELLANIDAQRARGWGAYSRRGLEVFRYAEAARVLRGKDFHSPFGKLSENSGLTPADGWIYDHMGKILSAVLGPEHVTLKAIFLEYFGPRAVERWRPDVADIIAQRLAAVAGGGTFDLAQDVCLVLPAYLFCRIINKQDTDAMFLAHTSDQILKIFEQNPENRALIIDAGRKMKQYTDDIVAERRRTPGDDLISFLIGKQQAGLLTEDQLTHNVAMLLEASVDNTGNQFALTMMHLLQEPGRWQQVVENPDLIKSAISESIRVTPKVATINRIASIDTEVQGAPVKQGTWVSISVLGAHRDPTGDDGEHDFQLGRGATRQPLVFGGGMHLCLGMLLSMVELEEGVATLARRLPQLRLAADPQWKLEARNITVQSMPVRVA